MSNENVEKVMSEYSDEKLMDLLRNRNDYQENAVEVAIKEAINRNIISDLNDLENKYPIYNKEHEKFTKELRFLRQRIDFQESTKVLYLIEIGFGLSYAIYSSSIPIGPIIYLGMIYYCSKYYNHTLANVIIWIVVFQIVAIILYILSLLLQLLV